MTWVVFRNTAGVASVLPARDEEHALAIVQALGSLAAIGIDPASAMIVYAPDRAGALAWLDG